MYTYNGPKKSHTPEFTGYMIDEADTIKSFDYSSIHRSKYFKEAMNYFDITDKMTRNILLSVNEADQNSIMQQLANRLYEHIRDDVEKIDFGTIPSSQGDITKIDGYADMVDCTNIITEILQQNHQSTECIETVTVAIQNMVDRVPLFTKAYKLNVEMPIIIYNTITMAIIGSVSYMINTMIELSKLPGDQGIDIALKKSEVNHAREHILFTDLKKFNNLCGNGDFDKAMDYIIDGNAKGFDGFGVAFGASSAVAILAIVLLIIPIIRELIFFFYYSRAKATEYLDAQSELLMTNAYNIENNLSRDPKARKEIAKKQKGIAEKFKKAANIFRVKDKTATQQTKKEMDKINKQKYKSNEVLDKVPDSANSTLF